MKTLKTTFLALVAVLALGTATAQEAESDFSVGADLVSSYVWRGTQFGSGPAIQPGVSYATGGLEIGAWGSNSFSMNEGFEADLYAGYSFDFGLGIAITDYYFGGDWTDGDVHYFEPALSYGIGDFSILAAYMIGGGKDENDDFNTQDTYLEVGYAFGDVSVFVGAGDGQYTVDGDFALANVGMSYSKDLMLGSFALPMTGSVILNPSTGNFYTVVGVSF